MEQYKTCTRCEQYLAISLFAFRKESKDKLTSWCKPCINEYGRQRRKNNPEAAKALDKRTYAKRKDSLKTIVSIWRVQNRAHLSEYQRTWRKNNKIKLAIYGSIHRGIRRSRISETESFKISIKEIEALYRLPCFYCGAPTEHLDHAVPISKGGNHSIGNLLPSCAPCNLSKGSKFIMEWRIWKLRLSL